MKKLLSTICLMSSFATVANDAPHNIIMVVADGMGPEFVTAYRYFNDDPKTENVERTIFDQYLIGSASTYPAPVSGYVTDSAAGATALATGVKTYNGAIAVDVDKKPLETVLERAKKLGLKTGAVVTSQVNHATPASYIAHNESRRNYDAIADSYVDDTIKGQSKVDVLLGGGTKYFIRDDRNLVNELTAKGMQYIDTYKGLSTLNKEKPALGLFAEVGLPWAMDDKNPHRLSAMTKTATSLLENSHGYFLLIEASQVDWAGHSNDIAAAMYEMDDLAKTMEYLESYVKANPNTTVVLTADHSTGGMSLGADGKYLWQPETIKLLTQSPASISKTLNKQVIEKANADALMGFELSDEEFASLIEAEKLVKDKIAEYETKLKTASAEEKKKLRPVRGEYHIEKAIKKIVDKRTTTGWTSGGHTAIDVPVIAMGENAKLFQGNIDNTDIAKTIFKLLEQDSHH